jgi:hypothetical protein
MTVTNLITYEGLSFEDYRALPGLSFSSTRDYQITEPTAKMKLGTALDAYLTSPKTYDGYEYKLISRAAPLVREKIGGLWEKLHKQLSYTCTFEHEGFTLLHRGRPDFAIPGRIVIDLKFVEHKAAVDFFDYGSQLSGYALALGCPLAFILEMSRKKQAARFIPVKITEDFWRRQTLQHGLFTAQTALQ